MSAFFFQLSLPQYVEMPQGVINEQRAWIDQLAANGRLQFYSVSALKDFIWCVINAEDEPEAMGLIADFPMFSFFTNVQCHLLLYYHPFTTSAPDNISMN
jgi:hypothetical protein